MTVWELFESLALRDPMAAALELRRPEGLDVWTYSDLREVAIACAARLQGAGVRTGDRCAILADAGPEWCATWLGILRAGAVAVPLATHDTAAELRAILDDAAPAVLFASGRLEPLAREALGNDSPIALRRVSSRHDVLAADGGAARVHAYGGAASDPALILYTSGTTADPKGVVLTHVNLVAVREAVSTGMCVTPHDRLLAAVPLFHPLAQLVSLVLPLTTGACVVFMEPAVSPPVALAHVGRGITVITCVPQVLYALHDHLLAERSARGRLRRVTTRLLLGVCDRLRRAGVKAGRVVFRRAHRLAGRQLRLVLVGGARVDPSVARDFYAMGFSLQQAYGLAETAGVITMTREDEGHFDTVGHVIPGHEVQVLESADPELGGEIAVRGPGLMHGYFRRPDATAAALRDGWLLTGDLGRLDAARRLTITGRRKALVVLATGSHLDPEEIEAQYRQSAFVKEICVLGVAPASEPSAERLHAIVVPDMALMRERRIVNAGDLVRFELEGQSIRLPPHKRVAEYHVWFEPLPRTATGALKRHEIAGRLAAAQEARSRRAGDWVPDAHAREVLDVVGRRARGAMVPDANLELDLGLDSLQRVEAIAALEHRLGVRLTADAAAQILTLRELIDAFRTAARAPAGPVVEDCWNLLLRDVPRTDDPALGMLLRRRRLAVPLFYLGVRLFRLLMPRLRASGLQHVPERGAFIISPNHQSYLDPFFVCAVLPYRTFARLFFVGAAEYFETPLTAWLARQCQLVPVDPDAHLVPAMKAGAFGLTHGKVLILFPEGERSIDGTVKRFKKGAPILSRQLGVPIVPVAIRGAFEVWPRNRAFNWRALLPWSRHEVHIRFGRPFVVDHDDYGEAAVALRQWVDELWRWPAASRSGVAGAGERADG